MKKLIATAMMFASLSLSSAALAENKNEYQYSFDPVHTQIMFKVDHLGFSLSQGRFTKFTGGFHFDEFVVFDTTGGVGEQGNV